MMKKLLILCLFCFCTLYGMGQNMVSGTVVDESGNGVIGATVLLKGTTKGVMTGPGDFSRSTSISSRPSWRSVFSVMFLKTKLSKVQSRI